MNPTFWFLIILIAVALWFALSILFKPMGKFVTKIFNDTKDIINDEEEKTEEKECKKVLLEQLAFL